MTAAEGGRRGVAALLEVLRAPLLLSPVADVYAGWILVEWLSVAAQDREGWRQALALPPGGAALLLAAAGAGICLLAAGMAQNALVDLEDDRRRKPDRPLPRRALSMAAVRATWALASVVALGLVQGVDGGPALALAIVAGTSTYHLGLKRWRVPGVVMLGLLRGGSLGLGVLAARTVGIDAAGPDPDLAAAWLGAALYALYIGGAALHASTDDEASSAGASLTGLLLASLVLGTWSLIAAIRLANTGAGQAALGLAVLAWALVRLRLAILRKPPPAVTGVALSGLHLLHAGVAALAVGPAAAAVMLLLFAASRALLRCYPPS